MSLARFIAAESATIVTEWEQFARTCFPEATIVQRRDHIEGMLKAIVVDLERPQSDLEQVEKSKGNDDADVGSETAANSHGTERATTGYTLGQMISEFRALRASVLRLWHKAQGGRGDAVDLEEVTRFNESVDQILAESLKKYSQEIDDAKDLLLGVLGHDLRNPLAAIMMSAAGMTIGSEAHGPHLKAASRIVVSCGRMDAMIRDILDFTRSRLGGGIPITRTDTDLEKVCLDAISELEASHPLCAVHLESAGPVRGEWDGERIAQAMSNLLGNAYQHGGDNTPVKVTLRTEPDAVTLLVHNQGPPIPKSELQNIFRPFRQLHPNESKSRVVNSLGLGLYISRAIAIAHNGTLSVDSTAEGGTIFSMRLHRAGAPLAK